MSRGMKSRLDRLERGQPDGPAIPLICWANLHCPLEDIQPDRSGIDWLAIRTKPSEPWSAETCPIEIAIRAIGQDPKKPTEESQE